MLKRTLLLTSPCRVSVSKEQLLFKNKETGVEKRVPAEDLGFLLIEDSRSTMTQAVPGICARFNVALIFCDTRHLPVAMSLRLDGHRLQQARFQAQLEASLPLKKLLWQQTVTAKLSNQSQALSLVGGPGEYIKKRVSQVVSGDRGNEEARAAQHYWKHFFHLAFQRRRDGDPPNSHLNYGYTILRAAMARALSGAGLLPLMGIHHRSQYNDFCLADDIMEPYRPFVDLMVHDIYREAQRSGRDLEVLEVSDKQLLLQVLTVDCKMDTKMHPLMVALQKTAWSLALCFLGRKKKIEYPRIP